MADTDFTKFVPGFDFLQGLVKNAGAALPGFGQWVAPTLNPQELERRIEELRTVQFWLEQNARMLAATIQALEVQRMTLSTLNAMNVPMPDLKDLLKTPTGMPGFGFPDPKAKPAGKAEGKAAPAASSAGSDADGDTAKAARSATGDAASGPSSGSAGSAGASAGKSGAAGPDPMQWWNALTQQFTQLASNAMKDPSSGAARDLATSMVKQSIDAAGAAFRQGAAMPGAMATNMAKATQAATGATAKAARAAMDAAMPAATAPAKSPAAAPAPAKRAAAKAAPKPPAKKAAARKPAAKRRAP